MTNASIGDIIRAANGIEPKYGRKTEGSQQSDASQNASSSSSNTVETSGNNTFGDARKPSLLLKQLLTIVEIV